MISEQLAERVREIGDNASDVIVASTGPTAHLRVSESVSANVQFVLAPPGTTTEALRELGVQYASGDIVTVLEGQQHGAFDVRHLADHAAE